MNANNECATVIKYPMATALLVLSLVSAQCEANSSEDTQQTINDRITELRNAIGDTRIDDYLSQFTKINSEKSVNIDRLIFCGISETNG